MSFGPDVQTVNNAATPISDAFVRELGGYLAADALGTGVGPLQQGAGRAITNFVNTGLNRVASGGMDPGTAALIEALSNKQMTSVNRQAADLREGFGAAGNRYSTIAAQGEGLLRSDAQSNLDAIIGDILVKQQQFNTGQLLAGIAEMSRQGSANLAPYLHISSLGLAPGENIAGPGFGGQLLSGGLTALGAYLGSR